MSNLSDRQVPALQEPTVDSLSSEDLASRYVFRARQLVGILTDDPMSRAQIFVAMALIRKMLEILLELVHRNEDDVTVLALAESSLHYMSTFLMSHPRVYPRVRERLLHDIFIFRVLYALPLSHEATQTT